MTIPTYAPANVVEKRAPHKLNDQTVRLLAPTPAARRADTFFQKGALATVWAVDEPSRSVLVYVRGDFAGDHLAIATLDTVEWTLDVMNPPR